MACRVDDTGDVAVVVVLHDVGVIYVGGGVGGMHVVDVDV